MSEPQLGRVLEDAVKLINGERQDAYGKPEDNFSTIASLWNLYIENRKVKYSYLLTPHDVAVMMALLKIARIATGTQKRDSYVDAAGYIGLAADLAGEKAAQTYKPGPGPNEFECCGIKFKRRQPTPEELAELMAEADKVDACDPLPMLKAQRARLDEQIQAMEEASQRAMRDCLDGRDCPDRRSLTREKC